MEVEQLVRLRDRCEFAAGEIEKNYAGTSPAEVLCTAILSVVREIVKENVEKAVLAERKRNKLPELARLT